jgi:hypothetical protein
VTVSSLKGNVAFSDSRGDFVQRGNNVNGLQLALLRTPPDFNNLPYIDPVTGLHRSFRLQNPSPGSASDSRGFDNPFFALFEPTATSDVGRVLGNIGGDYLATSWLKLSYSLGADYLADERLEGALQASSDVSAGGRVTEGKIVSYLIDHNLTASANWRLSDNIAGTFTLGQNLNQRNNRQLSVVGRTLVAPTPFRLSNTVVRDQPIDNQTEIRQESYFGQGTIDLWNQLYLTLALRNDGSSTFSEENRRNWFPKGSVGTSTVRRPEQPLAVIRQTARCLRGGGRGTPAVPHVHHVQWLDDPRRHLAGHGSDTHPGGTWRAVYGHRQGRRRPQAGTHQGNGGRLRPRPVARNGRPELHLV